MPRAFASSIRFTIGAIAIAWAGSATAQTQVVGTGDPAVDVPAVRSSATRSISPAPRVPSTRSASSSLALESPAPRSEVEILGNQITNVTEPAINFRRVVGRVDVEWNQVTTADVAGPGPRAEAIRLVYSGSYRIAHNSIECRWPQAFGIGAFSQFAAWPIAGAVVADNDVTMSPPDGTVFGPNSASIAVRGFARGNLVVGNIMRGRAGNAMSILPFQTGVPASNAFVLNRLGDFQAAAADYLVLDLVLDTLIVGQGTVEDHGVGTVVVTR